MKRLMALAGVWFWAIGWGAEAIAQCAMCRATLENNVSNGDVGIASNINFGILYLLVMPYLAIGIIGWFWYKNSKENARKERFKRIFGG
jgi:amino acid transporter